MQTSTKQTDMQTSTKQNMPLAPNLNFTGTHTLITILGFTLFMSCELSSGFCLMQSGPRSHMLVYFRNESIGRFLSWLQVFPGVYTKHLFEIQYFQAVQNNWWYSVVVSISGCDPLDPGSNPGTAIFFRTNRQTALYIMTDDVFGVQALRRNT
jgi:hypothetical protein